MIAENIPLRFAGASCIARLRELTGRDEYAVLGANTANAIDLLAGLLDTASTTEGNQICAADLVAADRDRILAAVYKRAFGDRIESTLTCVRCGQPFDLYFSLDRLIESVNESKETREWKALGDGRFEAANGVRFRLPTGNDELECSNLTREEVESLLLTRCAEGGDWPEGRIAFEELLEQVAPLIDRELVALCAECDYVHTVQFDIQSYLLGTIVAERRRLLAEINRIASSYSWSLDEILSLSRSDRRLFVELIENEYVT
jgi:hypothetical protein